LVIDENRHRSSALPTIPANHIKDIEYSRNFYPKHINFETLVNTKIFVTRLHLLHFIKYKLYVIQVYNIEHKFTFQHYTKIATCANLV
jgi:hypothetical protein